MKKMLFLLLVTCMVACSPNNDENVLVKTDSKIEQDYSDIIKNNAINANKLQIKVSEQTGNTNYLKLVNALAKASATNEILIDVNIQFKASDKAIFINKSNTTIVGAANGGNKFKLRRIGTNGSRFGILNSILVVKANNVTIQNIEFLLDQGKGYRCVFIGNSAANGNIANRSTTYDTIKFNKCDFKQSTKNDITRGLFFEGSFSNVTIDECFFNSWFSLVARDCPTMINFDINNNRFVDGSHQISLDGALLGEKDPKYGIGATLVNHTNIRVTNNVFGITKSFNLAIANTRNVFVNNNDFAGGTNSYSQPIHIEDHSRNIRIVRNRINNPNSSAILVYTTDKVGHGQGRAFTTAEKRSKGSGNVFIKNNTVKSKGPCIISNFLIGNITFEGQNTFDSEVKLAVRVSTSNTGAKIIFNDNQSTFNNVQRNNALSNGQIVIDSNATVTNL